MNSNADIDDIKEQLKQIDIVIGQKIKARRERLGISRKELAKAICVTQQQIAKYERSTNRISVSSLVLVANRLKKKICYFVPEIPDSNIRKI